jgi:hypothetical protein
MISLMRALFALLLAMGVAVLAIYVSEPRGPAITLDMPNNVTEAKAEFQRRVEAKYPIGMAEPALVSQLTQAGFELRPGYRTAHYSRSATICSLHWEIFWEPGADEAVTSIRGDYYESCL